MINKDIFENMSVNLKGDFVFQKGSFVGSRVYGFLKMVLYKTDSFFVQVLQIKYIKRNVCEYLPKITTINVSNMYQ